MSKLRRTTLATAAATELAAGLLTAATGTASAADRAASAANGRQGDFNGDGYRYRDLAVAAPAATVDGKKSAGAVTVLYGSAHGVDASRHTTASQNSPGVPGAAEAGDLFGGEVFLSDLNGEKKADLTVGAVYEDGGNGALTTLPSDGTRLTITGSRFVSPPAVGISTAGAPQLGSIMAE
ncbi:FG-GAP repeat protein [Streptomyces nigrescens]